MMQMQLFTTIFPLATEKQVKPVQIWIADQKAKKPSILLKYQL